MRSPSAWERDLPPVDLRYAISSAKVRRVTQTSKGRLGCNDYPGQVVGEFVGNSLTPLVRKLIFLNVAVSLEASLLFSNSYLGLISCRKLP